MINLKLETDRTYLRPFVEEDAPALGITIRDGNITETTLFDPPARTAEEGTERALTRIREFSDHWQRHGFGIFGAFNRQTDALIGYCGLRHIVEFGGDIHVSTMVDRPYWSRGLSSEILWRSLEFGFLDRGLPEICGATRLGQTVSITTMEHFGFTRQPDRMMRDWAVHYFVFPRDDFLVNYVGHLKRRIGLRNGTSTAATQPGAST
ncbi:MAG: GNAT family N-acetyltransferase [Alphaproteobacteria bacterium]|nr:GNAT family N-acetyltransferase [Alphaproteobacteria bacterium]MDP6563967.1 GNAT family N-acetyltransferase [Alphaproteobacteria bacterium]MDP6816384.1 GNAT family N-acetyltransferase [Alphaproteobacteria bacterium]